MADLLNINELAQQLGVAAPEEHFAPLGVSDIGERGAGALPSEMVALGVRESTAPVIDDEQFDAARHRWGGRLTGRRCPHVT